MPEAGETESGPVIGGPGSRPEPLTAASLVSAAISGLRTSQHTGVLIGEDHRIFGANQRASDLLQLPAITSEGIDWVGMTPAEFRAADDRAISDAVQYSASRWFRKEFILPDGERVGVDLLVIATEVNPFRWVALVRESGSSPLPAADRRGPALDDPVRTGHAVLALARRLAGARTARDVFAAVDRLGASALGCDYVNVATLANSTSTLLLHHDPSTDPAIRDQYPHLGPEEPSLLADACRHDMVMNVDIDEFVQRYPNLGAASRAMGMSHIAAVPMHTDDGRIIGALGLAWYRDVEPSPTEHVQRIADIVGNALSLASDTERARSMAASFQSMLLPARQTDVIGARVAVRYDAVDHAVGGDFYDVVPGGGAVAWFVIGDVVGHGLPASRTMGKIRFFLRAVMRTETDPAQVLARVHDLLLTEAMDEMSTCIVGRWDADASTLALASAGHLPPLRVGASAPVAVQPAPPLGAALAGWPPQTSTFDVEPGSRMLFYTDGLVERRDEVIDLSIERLRCRLADLSASTLDETADALLATATSDGQDDMALLLVEFRAN